MTVERITGEDLKTYTDGLPGYTFSPAGTLKFVILEGADGKGYVRADKHSEHWEILLRLIEYLRINNMNVNEDPCRGGGQVDIFHQKDGITRLSFGGGSQRYGGYDKGLLIMTLDEVLDKQSFAYTVV